MYQVLIINHMDLRLISMDLKYNKKLLCAEEVFNMQT